MLPPLPFRESIYCRARHHYTQTNNNTYNMKDLSWCRSIFDGSDVSQIIKELLSEPQDNNNSLQYTTEEEAAEVDELSNFFEEFLDEYLNQRTDKNEFSASSSSSSSSPQTDLKNLLGDIDEENTSSENQCTSSSSPPPPPPPSSSSSSSSSSVAATATAAVLSPPLTLANYQKASTVSSVALDLRRPILVRRKRRVLKNGRKKHSIALKQHGI